MKKISQESWVRGLVSAWNHHGSIARALLEAAECGGEVVPYPQWEVMIAQASKLNPRLDERTNIRQQVAAWIANHCVNANDALWDGKPDLAMKWMASGKDRSATRRAGYELGLEIARNKRAANGLLTVSVRDRDKRTDWKTVK